MEPLSVLIVLALIAAWAGIGVWAQKIGRPPIPFVLLAMFGSPILAAIVLVVIGPTLEHRDRQIEKRRAKDIEGRQRIREKTALDAAMRNRPSFEDEAYAQAWNELESNSVDPAIMARATEASAGQGDRAKALYVKHRVRKILDEQTATLAESLLAEIEEPVISSQIEIVDASGGRREITERRDGTFSLKTLSGGEKVFRSIEEAKHYLRG